MAQQPKTGMAQTTSTSEFLAKVRKLSEAKTLSSPTPRGKTRNYGAASRKQWSRTAEAPEPPAGGEAPAAPEGESPPDAD